MYGRFSMCYRKYYSMSSFILFYFLYGCGKLFIIYFLLMLIMEIEGKLDFFQMYFPCVHILTIQVLKRKNYSSPQPPPPFVTKCV